jgi:integrase
LRRKFTDKFVRSLRGAPPGKRIEHWDLAVPSFGVRVTDKGHKTYILYLRWPGSRVPTRREIGNADRLPLAAARTRAREWLAMVELGIDPRERQRADRLQAIRRRQVTFGAVAEVWLTTIKSQRKAAEVESDVRREFVGPLGARPITDIAPLDISTIIKAKAEKTPAQARNLLGYAKRLFDWAVHQPEYGIEKSPAERLRALNLIGRKVIRQRVLSDDELREVWEAAEETEYPYGPLFRMLILTGQRKSEVGDARWPEFDLSKREWRIPPERIKMKAAHVVPLSGDVIALLEELKRQPEDEPKPRFADGDCLFSSDFGANPVNGFSKAKERIDDLIGDKIDTGHENENKWTIHDLRRTVRTNLSGLPIPDIVRELMIAHAQKGMHAVYDQYSYLEEKRRGFELWAAKLRGLLRPSTGDNVVHLIATQ